MGDKRLHGISAEDREKIWAQRNVAAEIPGVLNNYPLTEDEIFKPAWHPILMSEPMMQANLAGLKDVTRRTSGLNEVPDNWSFWGWVNEKDVAYVARFISPDNVWTMDVKCPYGKAGDLLWVRETFTNGNNGLLDSNIGKPESEWTLRYWVFKDGGQMYSNGNYYAGLKKYDEGAFRLCKWKPSIHMPRAASRMTLQVTSIRIERLEHITGKECFREGLRLKGAHPHPEREAQLMFVVLWNSLHKKTGWEKDKKKFVWVIDYKIVKKP